MTFDEWYDQQGYSTNPNSNFRSVARKAWTASRQYLKEEENGRGNQVQGDV